MKQSHTVPKIVLAMMLLLSAVAPPFLPADLNNSVNPALASLAASHPDQVVSVIVQNADESGEAEKLVVALGGQVTKDLHIIHAFAAQLSAEDAYALSLDRSVRWVSLDAPIETAGSGGPGNNGNKDQSGEEPPSTPVPTSTFLDTLRVRQVWDLGFDGQSIAVAIIDSGITNDSDFRPKRLVSSQRFNPDSVANTDGYGHGTHVAGIVGGSGADSNGLYMGIAPGVDLISLKISGNTGQAYESDIVAALQWVLDNKDQYNIRVVNLSVNSTVESSYHESPMDAAAEILWFNGVVVVASVGNKGPGGGFNTASAAPANDPFIIAVGSTDERLTSDPSDDIITPFSARGPTKDGFVKPDIYAPGQDIISVLSGTCEWQNEYPDRVVKIGNKSQYFRLSGSSMSAPMVTGAVALLLQAQPNLTPDQVKYRLLSTSRRLGGGEYYLDVYAAVTGSSSQSANTGLNASQLLWSGDNPVSWDSVSWNSVSWNSVSWNSVSWNSVSWNSVSWNSVSWND